MMPPRYFPALTGLRAVAAYCVFLFHFPPVERTTFPELYAAFREGHIGVSIFFTLSGFLICRHYYRQPFSRAALGQYALRRWARIYPAFLVVTAAAFGLNQYYQADNAGVTLLANLTLLKGFFPKLALTGVAQAWSLTVEECFYLLAPPLFWLGRRFSPLVWAGVAGLLLALGYGLYGRPADGQPFASSGPHFMLVTTIFGRSTEFLLGAAFALAAPRARPGAWATWGGAGLLALVVALLTAIQLRTGTTSIDTRPGVALNNLLLPVATGLLLHGLATEASALQWLLSSRPAQLLGRTSYCFYLLHMGVLHTRLAQWLPAHWPAAPRYASIFALTVGAAILLYYLVEEPAHRLLLRRLQPAARSVPPVAATS